MRRLLWVVLILFILSGCDSYYTCDCFDECDRAIPFSFSTDSLSNGFKVSEIDTIFFYKFPKGQVVATDSAKVYFDPVYKGFYIYSPGEFICGPSYGFSLDGLGTFNTGSNFQNFDYQLKIPHLKTYKISDIVVEGKMSGGSCSCYTNKKKTFKVDGESFDFSGQGNPEPVVLKR